MPEESRPGACTSSTSPPAVKQEAITGYPNRSRAPDFLERAGVISRVVETDLKMKRIALASLVALATGLSTLSHAFDGRTRFSGKIFDTACKINSSDIDKLLELPQIKPGDFATNGNPANTRASPTEFASQLSNCTFRTGSSPKDRIKFDDLGARVDRNNAGQTSLTGPGDADNLQVNLYGNSAGTQITYE